MSDQIRFRVGRKLGRTIYVAGINPDDDPVIGMLDTPEWAQFIVDAVADRDRLKAEVEAARQVARGIDVARLEAQAEVDRLRELGNAMAGAIEERWDADGACTCPCCTAAREWRAHSVATDNKQRQEPE